LMKIIQNQNQSKKKVQQFKQRMRGSSAVFVKGKKL